MRDLLKGAFGRVPAEIEAAIQAEGMTSGSGAVFGPNAPINPEIGYSQKPRAFDYPAGVNLYLRGREGWGRTSFHTLRRIIDSYDAARMCINHRIDDIRSMELLFEAQPGFSGDSDALIDTARSVLAYPSTDRSLPFSSWLALWLEDVLRYDAGVLHRQRDMSGRVIGLDVVDGTTITVLIDEHGRRPQAPAPAFEQIIKGIVWDWFTTDDLVYVPFRPQPGNPYGLAPIESILLTANTDLRFQWHFLNYFTAGSLPAGFITAPPNAVSPDQIAEWQDYWDATMLGDQEKLRQFRVVPDQTKFQQMRDPTFDENFPKYLLTRVAAAFGVVPQDIGITDDVNRSTGETQTDVQFRVNTLPLVHYVEGILCDYLQRDLGLPVKCRFDTGQEKEDRLAEAQTWAQYIQWGVASPDEGREKLLGLKTNNLTPVGRFVLTARGGPIPLSAIQAVQGPVDPETFAPVEGAVLPHKAFAPVEGVVPNPPPPSPPLAVQRFGAEAQLTPAPPAVAPPAAASPAVPGVAKAELAAFTRFVKARERDGRWRDFTFGREVPAVVAAELNELGRGRVVKDADRPKVGAGDPRWHAHPVRVFEGRLTAYYATALRAGMPSEATLRALVEGFRGSDA